MIAKFQSGSSQICDSTPQGSLPRMEFGREICCSLANAEERETMLAARGNVTLPIINERSGAGCSAHLFLRICVYTTTQPEPLRLSSRLQIMCTATVSAQPVKSLDGDAPYAPRRCIARAWTVGELLRARTAIAAAAAGHTKTLTHGAAERVDRLGRAGT